MPKTSRPATPSGVEEDGRGTDDGKHARVPKLSRDAIIQEAARLFRNQGYENTSLEQLAEIFQVTRQALYYYYSSKEDLLWDINVVAQRLHEIEEDILAQDLAPLQVLKSFLWNFACRTAEHPDVTWCFYQEGRSLSPERRAMMVNRRREFTARVEDAYRDAARSGLVIAQDPKLVTFLMLGTISWIPRWYRSGGAWSPELIADTVSNMVVEGMLTEQGRSTYHREIEQKRTTERAVVFSSPERRRKSRAQPAAPEKS